MGGLLVHGRMRPPPTPWWSKAQSCRLRCTGCGNLCNKRIAGAPSACLQLGVCTLSLRLFYFGGSGGEHLLLWSAIAGVLL